MHSKLDLFGEFDAVSREEWIEEVKRYLKGKPMEGLDWNSDSGLVVEPYPSPNTVAPLGIADLNSQNNWKIVEHIKVGEVATANKQALEALKWGAESLQFEFGTLPTADELRLLLSKIHLSMIDIVFLGDTIQQSAMEFLKNLQEATEGQPVKGAVELGQQVSLECVLFIKDYLPKLSVVDVAIAQEGNLIENLANMLSHVSVCIDGLLAKGIEINTISQYFRLKVEVDDNYFIELSKIRAIKRLWLGILEAYEATEASLPHIAVITKSAATDNQHRNMITATAQTMAAAIGGANSILVTPSTDWPTADTFSLRIARNVQHLLKMESYLDRVMDPAMGSYYIESISQKIIEKSWLKFHELV
ncbi:MAG: hypothetical protein GY810_16245 [Aureispira sp.]|nr:hypothetical protein [Aureispira sp.]